MKTLKPASLKTPIFQTNSQPNNSAFPNVSAWQLSLTKTGDQKEPTLTIIHLKTQHTMRVWHGPVAHLIFKRICQQLGLNGQVIYLNKHQLQHALILSCLIHQQCLNHFQILKDLNQAEPQASNCQDILLLIRMSQHHLSDIDLRHFCDAMGHDFLTVKKHLILLESKKLIQRIDMNGVSYYDKNPIPHVHWFNARSKQLIDALPKTFLPPAPHNWQIVPNRELKSLDSPFQQPATA